MSWLAGAAGCAQGSRIVRPGVREAAENHKAAIAGALPDAGSRRLPTAPGSRRPAAGGLGGGGSL